MINLGKHPVLGVRISAVDYDYAIDVIINAARSRTPYSVTALAVHGVMTGFGDRVQRRRLNGIDLVLPDGQPVRWALNWIHHLGLQDRVRGPELTLRLMEAAAREHLPVYFYGSTEGTLNRLVKKLQRSYPQLSVAGSEPSRFRKLSEAEKSEVIDRIKNSGARLVFVGLGCPRQEVWVHEYKDHLPIPIIAVGAAFSFHAGELSVAPRWMQRVGFEWLYRLIQEPTRLWRRYLLQGSVYMVLIALEAISVTKIRALQPDGTEPVESYG